MIPSTTAVLLLLFLHHHHLLSTLVSSTVIPQQQQQQQQQPQQLQQNTLVLDNQLHGDNSFSQISFVSGTATNVLVLVFPCFGLMDWYHARGYLPTDIQYDVDNVGTDARFWPVAYNSIQPGEVVGVTIYAQQSNFTSENYTAKYDVLAYTNSATFLDLYPIPGDFGAITAQAYQAESGWNVDINITATGDTRDTYTLYQFSGARPGLPFYDLTACGALEYMTESPTKFSTNGTKLYTTLNGVIPSQEVLYTVVVNRTGGYHAKYITIQVGGVYPSPTTTTSDSAAAAAGGYSGVVAALWLALSLSLSL